MSTALLASEAATVEIDGSVLLPPVTFEAAAGEWWCLLGPNGSGKTTLLRALLGTRALSSGACVLEGETIDLARPRHRRRIAALVEPIPLARDLTVVEQVTMVAASWFGDSVDGVSRAHEVIDELGIGRLVDRFPHQLSAGQLQLFNLALVLVRPSEVLLLDEPERHLDADRVQMLGDVLRSRSAAGSLVVSATHDPALTSKADHELILG